MFILKRVTLATAVVVVVVEWLVVAVVVGPGVCPDESVLDGTFISVCIVAVAWYRCEY
jgi:hypothetical protein